MANGNFIGNNYLFPKILKTQNKDKIFIDIPSIWTQKKNSEKTKFSAYGYATYRLTILLPENSKDIKFDINTIRSAYKIWLNDSLCFETGNVGKNIDEHNPGLYNFNNFFLNQDFNLQNDTIQLIIQVSNYTVPNSSGIKNKIYIGNSNSILKAQNKINFLGYFAIGIFFIIGFYHFFIYFFRTREIATLFFGLMSLSVILRTMFSFEILESAMSNFNLFWFFIFIGTTQFSLFLNLYFYKLYKKEYGKIAIYITTISSGILTITAFLSPTITDKLTILYFAIIILSMLYLIFIVMPKSIKNKQKGIIWAYLGLLIMFLSSISDFLKVFSLHNLPYIAPYGFIAFTFFQAVNIAKRFSVSLTNNEKLNATLQYQNENLETIVKERTNTVEQQKEELISQNEELLQVSEELQSQAEELEVTNQELEKLSIVASETDNAVIIFDENYNLQWTNEAFAKIYGNTYQEFARQGRVNLITNTTVVNIEEILSECISEKKSVTYKAKVTVNKNIELWI